MNKNQDYQHPMLSEMAVQVENGFASSSIDYSYSIYAPGMNDGGEF